MNPLEIYAYIVASVDGFDISRRAFGTSRLLRLPFIGGWAL